jgi:hypothetical protein
MKIKSPTIVILSITLIIIFVVILILIFSNNKQNNNLQKNINSITESTNSSSNGFLTAFYSNKSLRPYSHSIDQLYSFLSNDQRNMQLYGWFYYGRVTDSSGINYPFFVAIQRISLNVNINLSDWIAIVAIKTKDGYSFIGSNHISWNTPSILIKQNPWSVEISGSDNPSSSFISISSDNNVPMGSKGASYSISFKGYMNDGHEMSGYVKFVDRDGVKPQGYGKMNMYPQWLFPGQSQSIISNYNGSMEKYLLDTNDSLDGQGSIYYTEMLLDVNNWEVQINNDKYNGNKGLLWVDIIGQSYSPDAGIITKNITWQFYAIQFPESGCSLLINQLSSDNIYKTGILNIATLFIPGKEPYHFPIDKISLNPDKSSVWKSPNSGNSYYLTNIATLTVDNGNKWIINIKSSYPDQEVIVNSKNIKYEGISDIKTNNAKLNNYELPTNGVGWIELIPIKL